MLIALMCSSACVYIQYIYYKYYSCIIHASCCFNDNIRLITEGVFFPLSSLFTIHNGSRKWWRWFKGLWADKKHRNFQPPHVCITYRECRSLLLLILTTYNFGSLKGEALFYIPITDTSTQCIISTSAGVRMIQALTRVYKIFTFTEKRIKVNFTME